MLSRAVIFTLLLLLPLGKVVAEIRTSGDCSPAVSENSGLVSVNCYLNDVPLDSVVRNGDARSLLESLRDGLSAELLLQAFALGTADRLSGVSFFENVASDEARSLLKELSKEININNRIVFSEGRFTSLFWLAASAKRAEIIIIFSDLDLAIHAPDHKKGGYQTEYVTKYHFPLLHLLEQGVITIEDSEILRDLFESSFVLPPFNIKSGNRTTFGLSQAEFRDRAELQKRVLNHVGLLQEREPFDMKNITPLCESAGRMEKFDWCARLKRVSRGMSSSDVHNSGWPGWWTILGLMNIRDGHAEFLVHHGRGWGGIGVLYVPRQGTDYTLALYNRSGSNAVPCWSDRLESYKTSCWRFYGLKKDLFDANILRADRGWPEYTARDETIHPGYAEEFKTQLKEWLANAPESD